VNARGKWSRALVIVGLIAMALGALDPLEGSFVIWLASALVAFGEMLSGGRHRNVLYGSFLLITAGVVAMWVMSAIGGIGGNTGHTMWWALVLIPYPVGWLLGLVFGVRELSGIAGPETAVLP
jgi:hypothetical protein